jgi:hypothetical protein
VPVPRPRPHGGQTVGRSIHGRDGRVRCQRPKAADAGDPWARPGAWPTPRAPRQGPALQGATALRRTRRGMWMERRASHSSGSRSTGRRFGGRRVRVVRRAYELRSRRARLRARGLLTLDEIAPRLAVCKDTIKLWRRQGQVPVRCQPADDDDATCRATWLPRPVDPAGDLHAEPEVPGRAAAKGAPSRGQTPQEHAECEPVTDQRRSSSAAACTKGRPCLVDAGGPSNAAAGAAAGERRSYASVSPSRMCSGSTRYSGAYSPSIPPSIVRSMTSSGILIFR